MKLRAVALALALTCGFTATIEARQKTHTTKTKHHKTHKAKHK